MKIKPIKYLYPKRDSWARTMVRCWRRDITLPRGGQAKAPIENAFVDAERIDDKMACLQMGIKLKLPFFRNTIFFPELLIL